MSERRTAASGDCEIGLEKNRPKSTGTFDEGGQPTRLWALDIRSSPCRVVAASAPHFTP